MVILSVAIISSGERCKTLLARQFVEMSRLRVEGLLGAFPKLIESVRCRDHTFIETETVRYVYQPMESLHLVIVTNKSSNILEDQETLRLLAKVVQDTCQIQVSEEEVVKRAFDIVFAFDEVISFGHRDSVTLSQIKTYCEMDSHEENLHKMIQQSKINEAREFSKQKQMELAKLRASQPKESSGGSGASGFGSGSGGGGGGSNSFSSSTVQESMSTTAAPVIPAAPWANSMSMSDDSGPAPLKTNAPKKGLMLGKKKPGDIFGSLGPAETTATPEATTVAQEEPAPVAAYNPLMDPVKVDIDEQIKANLEVEGGLKGEVEVIGDFKVTVLDSSKADLVCFKLAPQDQSFKYKVHPNLNKASHAQNILEVRDATKAYRPNVEAPLIKWRLASSKEDFLPISLSCWPEQTPEGTTVILEYELTDNDISLEDVYVSFPCPTSGRPVISSFDAGKAAYDSQSQMIRWMIPSIDSKECSSGMLEFTAAADKATLLPFQFTATRRNACKCPMEILECYHQERKEAISYTLNKSSTYCLTVGA